MKPRVRNYIDLYLNEENIKHLRKGYTVSLMKDSQMFSIHFDGRDRKVQREIKKLKAKIKELEGSK